MNSFGRRLRLVAPLLIAAFFLLVVCSACGMLLSIDNDNGDGSGGNGSGAGSGARVDGQSTDQAIGSGFGEAGSVHDGGVDSPRSLDAGACGTNLRDDFESTPGWSPSPPWFITAAGDGGVERSADGHGTLYGLRFFAPSVSASAAFETDINQRASVACTLRVHQWIKLATGGDSKSGFVLFEAALADGRTIGLRISPDGTVPATDHRFRMYESPSGISIASTRTFRRNEWIDLRISFEAAAGIYRLAFGGDFAGELRLTSGIPRHVRVGLLGGTASGFQERDEAFADDISVQY